jgi:hypothetical protein
MILVDSTAELNIFLQVAEALPDTSVIWSESNREAGVSGQVHPGQLRFLGCRDWRGAPKAGYFFCCGNHGKPGVSEGATR